MHHLPLSHAQGRANTAKIMEGVSESEGRLSAQMSEMMVNIEALHKGKENELR